MIYSPSASQWAGPAKPPQSAPHTPGRRSCEIQALLPDGTQYFADVVIPAMASFENAFTAFARGTVLHGPRGDIALEDLMPGDQLYTSGGATSTVRWIGSTQFSPPDASRRAPLIRAMRDAYGFDTPTGFLTLGPAARVLHHKELVPASALINGESVIEIVPPSPVRLYHLMLDRHETIRTGGLDCETFHPGDISTQTAGLNELFLSFFPHLQDGFGPIAYFRKDPGD